jgi:hypothetical protein
MATATKFSKSICIDSDTNDYVSRTMDGYKSENARLTGLIREAIVMEINKKLDAEAEAFYAVANQHRTGTLDFQNAALTSFDRE